MVPGAILCFRTSASFLSECAPRYMRGFIFRETGTVRLLARRTGWEMRASVRGIYC